jgi:phosphorylcholine metabolism protein LicD
MSREIEHDGFITRDEDLKGSVNMKDKHEEIAMWAWEQIVIYMARHTDEDGNLDPFIMEQIRAKAKELRKA